MDTVPQPAAPSVPQPATLSAPQPVLPAVPPVPGVPAAPPSIHVRAAISMMAAAPLMETWHPVFRAMGLTMVVVPTAVYVVLPRLFAAHGFLVRRRMTRR